MLDKPTPPDHELNLSDDVEEVTDRFYKEGWTDGLPVIPPTAERVERMLAGMPWRGADDMIGVVPPGMGRATLRRIAVNAVMAGCRPEYLPVIVAALQAVFEPLFGLAHRQTKTPAGAPLMIVHAPPVKTPRITACSARAGAPTPRSGARCASFSSISAGPSRRRSILPSTAIRASTASALPSIRTPAPGDRSTSSAALKRATAR